jgi:hypothetical protein
VFHSRGGSGQNLADGRFGQENLGCDCVAEPFQIVVWIGSVCQPVKRVVVFGDENVAEFV